VTGDSGALERLRENGPPSHAHEQNQTHITGMNIRVGGNNTHYSTARYSFELNLDAAICFPVTRWEYEHYYDAEATTESPKAKCRHASFLEHGCVISFDNAFFGLSDAECVAIPPDARNLMESSMEIFHDAGFPSRKSLNGLKVRIAVGDSQGNEFDEWAGYHTDPESWMQFNSRTGVTKGARLCYLYGTSGGMVSPDTACSATLVAHNQLHQSMVVQADLKMGLSIGTTVYTQPWGFIGGSKAGMLGASGRVLWSEQSAAGFAKGETVGGVFMLSSDEFEKTRDRHGATVGSFTNQDGRSASLTAPNGPSQQACIRGSARQSGTLPDDFAFHENHGTGTALGDPIEIGSVRAYFIKRTVMAPISISSSKTHTNHGESGAGSLAIIATLMNLLHAVSPPNCHLRQGNNHIEVDGFPNMFVNECLDFDVDGALGGCNGFGFGGTNSHADFWSRNLNGPHKTESLTYQHFDYVSVTCPQCLGLMCYRCGLAFPEDGLKSKHICNSIRSDPSSYYKCSSCYEGDGGEYLYAAPEIADYTDAFERGYSVDMTGTWSASPWSTYESMRREPGGVYVGEITLGATRTEQFQLAVEQDPNMMLFPIVGKARQGVRIEGPGKGHEGRGWLIDGRLDGVPSETVYRVSFEWKGQRKSIKWEVARLPTSHIKALPSAPATTRQHYFIACTWNEWGELLEMEWEEAPNLEGVYKLRFVMGTAGREEFQITVGEDWCWALHPPSPYAKLGEGTPVLGPDGDGWGLNWEVAGKPGHVMEITLHPGGGDATTRITCERVK